MKHRVAFVTTHPIQYQVPVFRHLAKHPELDFKVLFCQLPDARLQGDGFAKSFKWDIPLLDGYRYEVLTNVAARPSVTEFSGCDTPEIARRIRQDGFDAVIVNGWVAKSCLQTLWACKRAGIPCIVRGEANNIRPRPWWKRQIQRQLVRQYSACLYIGQANASFYRSHGVSDRKLFPALYCVDNDRFATAAAAVDRQAARRQFQLSSQATVFLFSGKLIEKKHPLELLAAIRAASDSGAKLECLIVGDGELRSNCEAYVKQFNLPVRFAGFLNQTQMAEAYVAADCLVLPSNHGETWGLVVNEAMACGRPAIVSNQVGCAADLIDRGQTGEVFRYGDWQELSQLLRQTAASPELLQRWGQAAQRRIADYSPYATARGIVQAVQSTCRQPVQV